MNAQEQIAADLLTIENVLVATRRSYGYWNKLDIIANLREVTTKLTLIISQLEKD